MSDPRVVLDASAVLAWLFKERGAETIQQLLPHAVVPAPNLTESLYRAVQKGHGMASSDIVASLTALGVRIEPLTADDVIRSAELIAASRQKRPGNGGTLSLGDGCCIAVAERLGLTISGGDTAWEQLDLAVPFLPFR